MFARKNFAKVRTNVLRKKFARFNFSPQASSEFLTHCILPNQHMEANRSATDAKTDVASVPGGLGGPQW